MSTIDFRLCLAASSPLCYQLATCPRSGHLICLGTTHRLPFLSAWRGSSGCLTLAGVRVFRNPNQIILPATGTVKTFSEILWKTRLLSLPLAGSRSLSPQFLYQRPRHRRLSISACHKNPCHKR